VTEEERRNAQHRPVFVTSDALRARTTAKTSARRQPRLSEQLDKIGVGKSSCVAGKGKGKARGGRRVGKPSGCPNFGRENFTVGKPKFGVLLLAIATTSPRLKIQKGCDIVKIAISRVNRQFALPFFFY
jgi:hypothetical protein